MEQVVCGLTDVWPALRVVAKVEKAAAGVAVVLARACGMPVHIIRAYCSVAGTHG